MKYLIKILFIFYLIFSTAKADEVSDWLKTEIDNILNAYKNESISTAEKFKYIENAIDNNFAGAGIAKFVAGKAWATADKETKKNYINLFKRHLALNIASLLRGYSDQTYSLLNVEKDTKNDVMLINMQIKDQTSTVMIVWRVKQSKKKYYIIDLLVADISLVVTKRSEFNSMLKKVDYSLKDLNDNLSKQNELSYNKLINNN